MMRGWIFMIERMRLMMDCMNDEHGLVLEFWSSLGTQLGLLSNYEVQGLRLVVKVRGTG
jgi:hypothetical protein